MWKGELCRRQPELCVESRLRAELLPILRAITIGPVLIHDAHAIDPAQSKVSATWANMPNYTKVIKFATA